MIDIFNFGLELMNTLFIFFRMHKILNMASNYLVDPEFCFPCWKCCLKFNTLRDFRKHICLSKLSSDKNTEENELVNAYPTDNFEQTDVTANLKVEQPMKIETINQYLKLNKKLGKIKNRDKNSSDDCVDIFEEKKHESKTAKFKVLDEQSVENRKESTIICDECGNKFKDKKNLKNHKLLHQRVPKNICEVDGCKKTFKTKRKYWSHKNNEHKSDREKYSCSECDKSFISEGGLMLHTKGHLNIFDYECDKCNKKFRQKGQLKIHNIVVHEKIYPTICPICGEGFPTKTQLKRHITKHTGEKNFNCKFCKKAFRLSGHRTKHELIHGDIREFACNMCPKRFRTADNLKVHIKRHLNQRDYICKVCNIAFVETSDLKRHKCLLK